MAIEYQLEEDLLQLEIRTPYSFDEAKSALEEATGDPSFRAGTPLLINVIRPANPPSGEIRRYALLVSRFREQLGERVALVAHEDLAFGLARMFAAFAEGAGLRVESFREREAAIDWLQDPIADDDANTTTA